MEKMVNAVKTWLVLAVGVTLLSDLVYVCVQQNIRMVANEVQIQMAEDAARARANQAESESFIAL